MRWMQALLLVVTVLSLAANVYFVRVQWHQDVHSNHYLWGNTTYHLIAGVTWADNGMDLEGRAAQLTLGSLRSLPRSSDRIDPDHILTMEQFLRRAAEVRSRANHELALTGGHSEETARQLAEVQRGFSLFLEHLHRVNVLRKDAYVRDHQAWRAMWSDIATGLKRLDLPR